MKKKYYLQIKNIEFYSTSPYTFMPNTEVMSFKTARKRETWKREWSKGIEGILCYELNEWKK